jgi:hypothetical protein
VNSAMASSQFWASERMCWALIFIVQLDETLFELAGSSSHGDAAFVHVPFPVGRLFQRARRRARSRNLGSSDRLVLLVIRRLVRVRTRVFLSDEQGTACLVVGRDALAVSAPGSRSHRHRQPISPATLVRYARSQSQSDRHESVRDWLRGGLTGCEVLARQLRSR